MSQTVPRIFRGACCFFCVLLLVSAVFSAAVATTVKISFAGDCTLGADQRWYNTPRSYIKVIEKEGMAYPFSLVKPLFEQDDLTMVNLEGVFKNNAGDKRPNVMYNFRAPTTFAEILRQGDIELVNLANNHTLDFGRRGFQSTVDALAEVGVNYCIDQTVYYFEKEGVKIAFLGFSRYSFRTHRQWVKENLPDIRKNKADFVIVNLHSGNEYSTMISPVMQRDIAYELIDYGADLIIGHHPHVLQGMEIYNNKPILYSIGNFSFGGNWSLNLESLDTVIVQADIEFDEQGFLSQQITFFPAHSSGTTEYNDYRPLLVGGEAADQVIAKIQKGTDFPLNPYVKGVGAVQEKLVEPRK